jgi:1-deoxy-D-xylulose 5-phosphate reductoisomerase
MVESMVAGQNIALKVVLTTGVSLQPIDSVPSFEHAALLVLLYKFVYADPVLNVSHQLSDARGGTRGGGIRSDFNDGL